MASSRGSVHSDTAKKEQIITEFFTKSLQIVLESRSPYMSSRNYVGSSPSSSSSSSSSSRSRDKWFNLALRECPAALENIDFWRQNNLEPMVIDVILVQGSVGWDHMNFSPKRGFVQNQSSGDRLYSFSSSEQECLGHDTRVEKVIERWVVEYENPNCRDNGSGSKRLSGNLHSLYKKSIVLLRSLYVTIRLLPGYKLFRDLISSGQLRTYTLTHRISSFVEPFTRREEADMERFHFSPVDTSSGRLCLSVSYRSKIFDVNSEPSSPMSVQFISDYVGSPLADPLRRLPSLPMSHGSPASPFARCRSWSNGNYRASSPLTLPSPSPTYSDSHTSVSKSRSRLPAAKSFPHHSPDFCQGSKNMGFDEYCPSPVFSPSHSPSPPLYTADTDQRKSLLRCESAPESIPGSKTFNMQIFPPTPKLARASTQKSDSSVGPSGSSFEKCSLERGDGGRYSGAKISANSSPRASYFRNSSLRSTYDDFDDSEFACPFVVDYEDMKDNRPKSLDQKRQLDDSSQHRAYASVGKSQDAAVGALVLMLNKAPPLRQDSLAASKAAKSHNTGDPAKRPSEEKVPSTRILSSSIAASKTTADALEELQAFKKMKDFLLCQKNESHVMHWNVPSK